jgi:hypothetical protein
MSLEKEFIRDGKRRIIGSVTSGFSDESAVRPRRDNISGRQRKVRHPHFFQSSIHGGLLSENTSRANRNLPLSLSWR